MNPVRLTALAAAFASSVLSAPVPADEALVRRHNCVLCHELEKTYIGPGFHEVAQRYKGQADAAPALYEKVRKGGAGVWGKAAMPPNRAVPADDIRKIVDWVLKSD